MRSHRPYPYFIPNSSVNSTSIIAVAAAFASASCIVVVDLRPIQQQTLDLAQILALRPVAIGRARRWLQSLFVCLERMDPQVPD